MGFMNEHTAIPIANPDDNDWADHLYLMWAGMHGYTRLYVWANDLDKAFEHLAEWLDDNAPGMLATVSSVEDEADMTMVGHTQLKHGNAIPSWEWGSDEITDAATLNTIGLRSIDEAS